MLVGESIVYIVGIVVLGCVELDVVWSFYYFFFCLEIIWCGYGVVVFRVFCY